MILRLLSGSALRRRFFALIWGASTKEKEKYLTINKERMIYGRDERCLDAFSLFFILSLGVWVTDDPSWPELKVVLVKKRRERREPIVLLLNV